MLVCPVLHYIHYDKLVDVYVHVCMGNLGTLQFGPFATIHYVTKLCATVLTRPKQSCNTLVTTLLQLLHATLLHSGWWPIDVWVNCLRSTDVAACFNHIYNYYDMLLVNSLVSRY